MENPENHLVLDDDAIAIHGSSSSFLKMEHLFGKVATPSDVGKLNRLVIPKQYAEKYFPLVSSSCKKKGVILNFKDPNGKSWRFRYSYWKSSQSYVITKGWSRFVKENKLNAGDLISFGRSTAGVVVVARPVGPAGAGSSSEEADGFYISCRRRQRCHVYNNNAGDESSVELLRQIPTRRRRRCVYYYNSERSGSEISGLLSSSATAKKIEHDDDEDRHVNVPVIIDSMQQAITSEAPKQHFRLFGVDVEYFSIPSSRVINFSL